MDFKKLEIQRKTVSDTTLVQIYESHREFCLRKIKFSFENYK